VILSPCLTISDGAVLFTFEFIESLVFETSGLVLVLSLALLLLEFSSFLTSERFGPLGGTPPSKDINQLLILASIV